MSNHSTYEAMRQFADSWGLLATMILFIALALWPFRSGGRDSGQAAANSIFVEDDNQGDDHGKQ